MQYSYATTKRCCALCFTLVLFSVMCFGSCSTKRWRLVSSDSATHAPAISALAFTDSNHGWALTPWDFSETEDGGRTWTERLTSSGERAFYSFTFVSQTTGWIVGSQRDGDTYGALIMQTTDGGKTWQRQATDIVPRQDIRRAPRFYSVSFCNSSSGWAAGSGVIVRTADGGQTWETQRSANTDEELLGITCISPERAWAVGQDGVILYTEDGGRTWNRQQSNTESTLLRVRFLNGNGWIVGLNGTLLKTRDGGLTWQHQQLDSSAGLFDIYVNDRQGWIVGSEGTILHTEDGGRTWRRQESPTDNDLTSLFFINTQQGWAGGSKSTLLRFSD